MKRRRIVTTFTDQGSEQYKNKGQGVGFFPKRSTEDSRVGFQKSNPNGKVKVYGDTDSAIYSTQSNLNLKNDYEKRVLSLTTSLGDATFSLDSSKDNDTYFNGHRKFIDLKFSFLSGTNINPGLANYQNIDAYGPSGPVPGNIATQIALNNVSGTVFTCGFEQDGANDGYFTIRGMSPDTGRFDTLDRFRVATNTSLNTRWRSWHSCFYF